MPNNSNLYNVENIKPLKDGYQDVNKNKIKVMEKVWLEMESVYISIKVTPLITKRSDYTLSKGGNWLSQITNFKISLDEEKDQSGITNRKVQNLFETNHTNKKTEIKTQSERRCLITTKSTTNYRATPMKT